jgi:hypothetical protein
MLLSGVSTFTNPKVARTVPSSVMVTPSLLGRRPNGSQKGRKPLIDGVDEELRHDTSEGSMSSPNRHGGGPQPAHDFTPLAQRAGHSSCPGDFDSARRAPP